MKKLKVFAGDTRLKDVWVGASKWEIIKFRTARFLRKLFIITSIIGVTAGVSYASFKAGGTLSPITVFADKIVQVPVVDNSLPPVLIRIEKCESSDMQNNSQGQTLIHVNSNGTYDQGEFQINSTWNSTATKLGYDLSTAQGNEDMAKYLYANIGTSPWSASSAKCWNK
jgi:hypothetical protein